MPTRPIGDRFVVQRQAGSGGMGVVFQALDLTTGELAAVKVLRHANTSELGRFDREVQVLRETAHPHVVRYLGHGRLDSGELYLAMEWLSGIDLKVRLHQGPIPPLEAVGVAHRVASALAVLHDGGIVHRDIKPSNVFLVDGRIEALRVVDFGIARKVDRGQSLTGTGNLVGTPAYIAPELARGRRASTQADVYSLGCLLFECLMGRPAFEGQSPVDVLLKAVTDPPPDLRAVRPDLPDRLAALVATMLAKAPEQRPEHGRAAARELEAILGEWHGRSRLEPQRPTAGTLLVAQLPEADLLQCSTATMGDDDTLVELRRTLRKLGDVIRTEGRQVGVLVRAPSVVEGAVRAAEHVLACRERFSGVKAALAPVVLDPHGQPELAAALTHAHGLLRGGPAMSEDGRAPVVLDDAIAGLLQDRMPVHALQGRLVVHRPATPVVTSSHAVRPEVPLVGRERDLKVLDTWLRHTLETPSARLVVLVGDDGVGKSRLCRDLLHGRGPGIEVWHARADAMQTGLAYGLLARLIRNTVGLFEDEGLDTGVRKLAARLSGLMPAELVEPVAQILGEVAGLVTPRQTDDSGEGHALRVEQAVAQWLYHESRRPLILHLDDVHWADAPSVEALSAAVQRLETRPLFVLMSGRTDMLASFPQLSTDQGGTVLELPRLLRLEAERLLERVALSPLKASVAAELVDRAAGQPLAILEFARTIVEDPAAALPTDVTTAVQARVRRLPPAARRILRVASVFGDTFFRGALHSVLDDLTDARLEALLQGLVSQGLIEPRARSRLSNEQEFQFSHPLLRKAVYKLVDSADRLFGHAKAAKWLQTRTPGDTLSLGRHYQLARDDERAAGYYLEAGRRAFVYADFRAAHALALHGMSCGASDRILAQLQEIVRLSAPSQPAEDAGDDAPEGARQSHTSMFLRSRADLAMAVAMGVERQAFAGEWAEMEAAIHRLELTCGDLAPAEPGIAGWLDTARHRRAWYLRGDVWQALDLARAAESWFRAIGDRHSGMTARLLEARSLRACGAVDRAAVAAELLAAEAEAYNYRLVAAEARCELALALLTLRGPGDALPVMASALSVLLRHGTDVQAGLAYAHQARISLGAGMLAPALEAARQASTRLATIPPFAPYAAAVLARARLAAGRPLAALDELLEQATGLLEDRHRVAESEGYCWLTMVEGAAAAGLEDLAGRVAAQAHAVLQRKADLSPDPEARYRFLFGVPEHRALVERADPAMRLPVLRRATAG